MCIQKFPNLKAISPHKLLFSYTPNLNTSFEVNNFEFSYHPTFGLPFFKFPNTLFCRLSVDDYHGSQSVRGKAWAQNAISPKFHTRLFQFFKTDCTNTGLFPHHLAGSPTTFTSVQALFQDSIIHLVALTTLHISKAREQTEVKAQTVVILKQFLVTPF